MNSLLKKKIIFGTASLNLKYGIHFDKNSTNPNKLLEEVYNENIRSFDTAIDYKNDKILGSFLKNINFNAKIFTKLDIKANLENLISSINKHIDNLGMVPNYFLIRSNKTINKDLVYKIFHYLLSNYPNMKVGASIYEKKEFIFFKSLNFEIFQFPFNIFNNEYYQKTKNDLFIARSIFLQGLLTINKKIFLKEKKLHTYLNNFKKEYFLFLQNKNISPSDVCINYVISNKDLDNIIISTNNIDQLNNIIHFSPLNKKTIKEVSNFVSMYENKMLDPRNWN